MKSRFYFLTLLSSSFIFSSADVQAMDQQIINQNQWNAYERVKTIYFTSEKKPKDLKKIEVFISSNTPKNKAYSACLFLTGESNKNMNPKDAFSAISSYVFDAQKTDPKKNDPFMCYFLGFLYETGKGTQKNMKEAVTFYEIAHNLGNVKGGEAINRLGMAHMLGKGIDKNENQAFDLFKKAHNLGILAASFNLARCYEGGKGVDKNEKQALEYYQSLSELKSTQQIAELKVEMQH
jgi:TPR repeat protein